MEAPTWKRANKRTTLGPTVQVTLSTSSASIRRNHRNQQCCQPYPGNNHHDPSSQWRQNHKSRQVLFPLTPTAKWTKRLKSTSAWLANQTESETKLQVKLYASECVKPPLPLDRSAEYDNQIARWRALSSQRGTKRVHVPRKHTRKKLKKQATILNHSTLWKETLKLLHAC